MNTLLLAAHNLLRWVVLVAGIAAAVGAWVGWLRGREWAPAEKRWGLIFTIGLDIQLLLGALLYFFFSPIVRTVLSDFGVAMANPGLRFFALEHAFYMLLAVIIAHLGSILSRRATASAGKFQRSALAFSLAMVMLMLGMPWARPLLPWLG